MSRVVLANHSRQSLGGSVAFGLALSLAAVACSAHGPAVETKAPRPREPVAQAPLKDVSGALADHDWVHVRAKRFALRIPLPDASGFRVDDRSEPWFVARHAASRSELRFRTWSAARLVKPEECEAQVRLWLPNIADPVKEGAMERRPLHAPEGYRGHVWAGVRVLGEGAALEGYALAFGANVGHCYAAIFSSKASGPGAELRLGQTLGVAVGGILDRVEALDAEDRAVRRRFPF